MAGPADFAKIAVLPRDVQRAQARYAEMGERALAGEFGWAGFAAEFAVIEAINRRKDDPCIASESPTLDYDMLLEHTASGGTAAVEIKTRVASEGWTHPEKFQWLVVPTHDGREPIKPAADLVIFCWFAVDSLQLWVLGSVRGAAEFSRRAVFYQKDEPLPRGGWAGDGGAYCIEVKQLRPLPRGFLKEEE